VIDISNGLMSWSEPTSMNSAVNYSEIIRNPRVEIFELLLAELEEKMVNINLLGRHIRERIGRGVIRGRNTRGAGCLKIYLGDARHPSQSRINPSVPSPKKKMRQSPNLCQLSVSLSIYRLARRRTGIGDDQTLIP
jgi:hypothetical protein